MIIAATTTPTPRMSTSVVPDAALQSAAVYARLHLLSYRSMSATNSRPTATRCSVIARRSQLGRGARLPWSRSFPWPCHLVSSINNTCSRHAALLRSAEIAMRFTSSFSTCVRHSHDSSDRTRDRTDRVVCRSSAPDLISTIVRVDNTAARRRRSRHALAADNTEPAATHCPHSIWDCRQHALIGLGCMLEPDLVETVTNPNGL